MDVLWCLVQNQSHSALSPSHESSGFMLISFRKPSCPKRTLSLVTAAAVFRTRVLF